MKKEWICQWTIGQGEEEKMNFKNYEDAYSYVRKLISENIDISKMVKELKSLGNFQFTNALVGFLTKYVGDPCFPERKEQLPSDDPEDYEDYDTFPEDDYYYGDDETSVSISSGGFYCKYNGYNFSSDFLIDKPILEDNCLMPINDYSNESELTASYNNENNFLENDLNKRTPCFSLRLSYDYVWKSSAYPIMILRILESSDEPLDISGITESVKSWYNTSIERKAIGRHISLLKSLGYNIKHSKEGYYMEKYLSENMSDVT